MLAILYALVQTAAAASPMVVASNTRVDAVEVAADRTLLSRTIYSDGTFGECRRVVGAPAGWLDVECRTGVFLGQDVYQPVTFDPARRQPLSAGGVIGHPPFLRPLP